jgi:uncharacterized RDD family membrane protein YckC
MTTESDRFDRQAHDAAAARLLPRAGARLIDAVILAVVGGSLGVALEFGYAWLVLQALLVFAYFVVLDVSWGTTVGKRVLGLAVTGPDGGPPTVGQAVTREVFTLLGAIPFAGPVLALVAWIVIAVTISSSPSGQGKHDELAGRTRVIRLQ